MSTEANKAAVQRFRVALNAGDIEEAMAVFAPDAIVHPSGAPNPLTVDQFKQLAGPCWGRSPAASRPSSWA